MISIYPVETLLTMIFFLYLFVLFNSVDYSPKENTEQEDFVGFVNVRLLPNVDGGSHAAFAVNGPLVALAPTADCSRAGLRPTSPLGLSNLEGFLDSFGSCTRTGWLWPPEFIGFSRPGCFIDVEGIPVPDPFRVSALELNAARDDCYYLGLTFSLFSLAALLYISMSKIAGGLISLDIFSSWAEALAACSSSISKAFKDL